MRTTWPHCPIVIHLENMFFLHEELTLWKEPEVPGLQEFGERIEGLADMRSSMKIVGQPYGLGTWKNFESQCNLCRDVGCLPATDGRFRTTTTPLTSGLRQIWVRQNYRVATAS